MAHAVEPMAHAVEPPIAPVSPQTQLELDSTRAVVEQLRTSLIQASAHAASERLLFQSRERELMATLEKVSLEIRRVNWEMQANSERDAREVDTGLGAASASRHDLEQLALLAASKEAAFLGERVVLEADAEPITWEGKLPRMR